MGNVNYLPPIYTDEPKRTYYEKNKYSGNLTNGIGTITYANGDKYIGNFLHSNKHGYGVITYTNNVSEFCLYNDDEITDVIVDLSDEDRLLIKKYESQISMTDLSINIRISKEYKYLYKLVYTFVDKRVDYKDLYDSIMG